jgi:hypothetical protein
MQVCKKRIIYVGPLSFSSVQKHLTNFRTLPMSLQTVANLYNPKYEAYLLFKNMISVHTSTGAADHSITEAPNQSRKHQI